MRRRRSPKRRNERRGGSARGLLGALAAFVILCGVLLAVFGPGRDDEGDSERTETRDPVVEHLLTGLEATREAQRALERANYGEVRSHLERARESLTSILAGRQGLAGDETAQRE